MRKALVVVDMQDDFYPSEKAISNCRKQVELAIKEDMDIVFVEYESFGETVAPLWEAIKKTKHGKISTVLKYEWDGSLKVKDVIDKFGHKISGVRVIGVYTSQCVHATVRGLRNRLPETSIEVIEEACEDMSGTDHIRGIANMKLLPNVKVI